MEKIKVLFVSQEITPYLPESEMSVIGRYLPQGILEKGREIRAFMPRYGLVNERRNQLHEVISLLMRIFSNFHKLNQIFDQIFDLKSSYYENL